VTVHALVPRVANAEDVFHDLRAGLDVAAASKITLGGDGRPAAFTAEHLTVF
jgi:hypothetical protein